MATYRLSPRAEVDLEDIARYTIEKWGVDQADGYITELRQSCQLLADNPMIGRLCEELAAGLRRFEKEQHVIFYRKRRGGVTVTRILHKHMLATKNRFPS